MINDEKCIIEMHIKEYLLKKKKTGMKNSNIVHQKEGINKKKKKKK